MDLTTYLDEFDNREWERVDSGTVRIALIGMGWWTREHAAPAIEASDRCEATVAVSSRPHEAATGGTSSIERAMTYEDFHDGVGTDDYDAVYIATPNALHLPHAEAAAAHGKHVLCEKPMEASVERAEAMVEAVADARVSLMIGYRMQTEPTARRARDLVRDGVIGEPAYVHSHMSQRLLELHPDLDQWRLDPDLTGPGTSVTDLGIYPINTTRFVLDDEPSSVTATMRSAAPGFERVPDERASFELEFEGGALASCATSQNAHRSSRFEVVGTDGRLVIEPAFFADLGPSFVVERDGSTVEVEPEPVDQMTEEFDYFADRVLGGGPVGPDGEHGLVDVRIIEAIYEAASSGRRIWL